MSTYTDELQAEVERVTLRGNADKNTIRKLASIIFRMDQRIRILEGEIVVDDKPALEPIVEEPKKPAGKTVRQVQPKTLETKSQAQSPSDETSEA
jgi:hypothetical protein